MLPGRRYRDPDPTPKGWLHGTDLSARRAPGKDEPRDYLDGIADPRQIEPWVGVASREEFRLSGDGLARLLALRAEIESGLVAPGQLNARVCQAMGWNRSLALRA